MTARVLVVDNYDSFVYNLVQYLGELGAEPVVCRNDAVTVDGARRGGYAGVLISPGPGGPEDAGASLELIRALSGELPLLGVCLGHQCIAAAFGGVVVRHQVMHGKTSQIRHDGKGVFSGLPDPLVATRYHSLVVSPQGLPAELVVTARAEDDTIMGIRHRVHAVEGVQFHPESILTEFGRQLVANWLAGCAVASG